MIRTARTGDEKAIRACAALAYERYVAAIGRQPAPMVADFAAQIASGDVYVSVSADDQVRGFIVFRPEADAMFLENVAVRPDACGAGIGKTLIAFCEAAALDSGLKAVRLYTNAKMAENLAIYPRLGYVETARRSEDGFDRVYFEKRLV